MDNLIVVPVTKITEIITCIQVYRISRMNINYKKNGGRKAFLANPKHQCCASQWVEHDCSEHNKKNVGDFSGNPCLSNFMDEHKL